MNSNNDLVKWLFILLGFPATLAWIAYGMAWLLEPRLTFEVVYIQWAFYAAAGWYAFLVFIVTIVALGSI